MLIDDLVTELKVYLKIKETDIDNDDILTQAIELAAGYVVGNYSYYILDDTVDKKFIVDTPQTKHYLNASPVASVTTTLDGVAVVDNDPTVINNTAYYPTTLGTAGEVAVITATVGISDTKIEHKGDIAQATALAAYFYKQADKGLDGVMQYGTGIKESARLYEGIPKAILQYFETRKLFRF